MNQVPTDSQPYPYVPVCCTGLLVLLLSIAPNTPIPSCAVLLLPELPELLQADDTLALVALPHVPDKERVLHGRAVQVQL